MEEFFNLLSRLWWSLRAGLVLFAAGDDSVVVNTQFISEHSVLRPRKGRMLFLNNDLGRSKVDVLSSPSAHHGHAQFAEDSICPICGESKSPGIRAHYPYCLERLERRSRFLLMSRDERERIGDELEKSIKSSFIHINQDSGRLLNHLLEDLRATQETIVEASATRT